MKLPSVVTASPFTAGGPLEEHQHCLWLRPIEPDGGEFVTTTSDNVLAWRLWKRSGFCN